MASQPVRDRRNELVKSRLAPALAERVPERASDTLEHQQHGDRAARVIDREAPQLLARSWFPTVRMRRFAVIAAAALTAVGTAAAPAAALDHQRVARAACKDFNVVGHGAGHGDRLGPFSWIGRRGSRRVHRQMISVNMGANCRSAEPAATTAGSRPRATVAYARCDDIAPQRDVVAARERFGPVTFLGNWDGYAQWLTMERFRSPEGTFYAKNGFGVRARAVGTLSIAPAYRDSADFIYGRGRNGRHVLSDVVRVRGCTRRGGFVSGGLIVRGPACVLIEARRRGSRRVQRRMVSINKGADCPAL